MPIFNKRQQMRRLSAESDDESASSTATLTDFWSAGTSSIDDGSSSRGSMPWAAEAIEQNRREWLGVEEILYGERELPENERLRDELMQWMERFPYVRVRGNAIGFKELVTIDVGNYSTEAETLAIDPQPPKSSIIKSYPKSLELENRKRIVNNSITSANRFVSNTTNLLEKCLQITSSSWSKRPSITSGKTRFLPPQNTQSSVDRVKSVRSDIHRQSDFYGQKANATNIRTISSSSLAQKTPLVETETSSLLRFRRPPPVPLINVRSNGPWESSRSTAGRSSRITLPPITNHISRAVPRSRPSELPPLNTVRTVRSVSAIHDLPRRN